MLEALARDPRVNLAWLLRGEGQPTDMDSSRGIATPISRQIIPGLPEENQAYLSGETFALSPHLYRPTRYWFEIQPGDPVLRSGLRIGVRDLLLMEADHRAFPSRERLFQHLCGVKISGVVKLGLATYFKGDEESGPARLEVDTLDLGVDPSEVRREEATVPGRSRKNQILYRWVRDKTGKNVKEQLTDFDLNPLLPTIEYEGIVCVCLLVVRRSPGGI